MSYKVQTNENTPPEYVDWVTRGEFDSEAEARAFIADQSTAEGVNGEMLATTFGLNGVRLLKS